MTTIDTNGAYATLINVFTVEPDVPQELAALLSVADRRGHAASAGVPVREHPPEHRPHPGRQLRAMGQCRRISAMQANPDCPRAHVGRGRLPGSFDPHLYTVESVHDRE